MKKTLQLKIASMTDNVVDSAIQFVFADDSGKEYVRYEYDTTISNKLSKSYWNGEDAIFVIRAFVKESSRPDLIRAKLESMSIEGKVN